MLKDQLIIITGASRGLGRAMALAVAQHGAIVIAAARTTGAGRPDTIQETARLIEAAGGKALAVPVEVRDEAQVAAMVEQVLDCYGRVDVLVNNAGLMVGNMAFTDTTPALWRDIVDTNSLPVDRRSPVN